MALTAIVSACSNDYSHHAVWNESGQEVVVTYETADGSRGERALGPGKMLYMNYLFGADACSAGVLVARATDGREIARRSDPLCPNDAWIIKAP